MRSQFLKNVCVSLLLITTTASAQAAGMCTGLFSSNTLPGTTTLLASWLDESYGDRIENLDSEVFAAYKLGRVSEDVVQTLMQKKYEQTFLIVVFNANIKNINQRVPNLKIKDSVEDVMKQFETFPRGYTLRSLKPELKADKNSLYSTFTVKTKDRDDVRDLFSFINNTFYHTTALLDSDRPVTSSFFRVPPEVEHYGHLWLVNGRITIDLAKVLGDNGVSSIRTNVYVEKKFLARSSENYPEHFSGTRKDVETVFAEVGLQGEFLGETVDHWIYRVDIEGKNKIQAFEKFLNSRLQPLAEIAE